MNETMSMILSLITGLGLGIFFYGGLYFTVKRGLTAKIPALVFTGSFILRTAVTLMGFMWVSQGKPMRLLAVFAGFLTIRLISLLSGKIKNRKSLLQERE